MSLVIGNIVFKSSSQQQSDSPPADRIPNRGAKMDKHEYKGSMPICMFKDPLGTYCHLPRRHEIHNMRAPDSPVHPGVSYIADIPQDPQEVTDTNHKVKDLGDSASIIFRAQNIEEIAKQEDPAPPAEVIEAQNQILDYAVNVICSKGTWENNQRDEISRLINSFRNTMLLLNAKAQKLHVFRAQKDVEYTSGFTDEERAEFERAARRMEKADRKKGVKLTVNKAASTGTKAQFIKDQMKTGLYDLDECEAMWVKVEAKKAATALSGTDKPKSVTNIASAGSSMERHGLSKEQVERIMKGKQK